MSATPQQLYDEFLEHYDLEKGLYYHSIELLDHPFEKVEKVQGIRIGDTLVPLSPAVANSVKFNVQLHLAPINAEKEIKKYIGSYKGLILDDDDVNLFCFTAEQTVLSPLLWPLNLLTHHAELTERHFFPLADMMEGIVCDTQDAVYDFFQAVLGSTDRIDAKRDREIDSMKRRTDDWAANAPVEVRGSIRRNGRYLEVSATARSTVTSGMINAEYQAHNLVANLSANREKAAVQKSLMDQLEKRLLDIIKPYTKLWYERLKQLDPVIGKNVLRDSIIGGNVAYRPDQKDNMIEIIKNATGEISYSNLKRLIDYYGYDCDDLIGNRVAIRILNSFIQDKEIDVENFYYDFYGYYYDVEHPLECEQLFSRFRETAMGSLRKMCDNIKAEDPDYLVAENRDKILLVFNQMAEILPGITQKQKNRLSDDACSVFYEAIGDTKESEYYKQGAPRFEF